MSQLIIDYQTLIDRYKDYSNPREKISKLIKQEKIIRVKKGLYIDAEIYKTNQIPMEVLANLIYGPSYISFEYALSYYGFIPEKVHTITSATLGRSRLYKTQIGTFSYKMINPKAYPIGIDLIDTAYGSYHIASPTKAIADKIVYETRIRFQSKKKMKAYLFEDLRIDEEALTLIDNTILMQITKAYKSSKLKYLSELVEELNGK